MRFIAEDNPNLYIDVENYSELEERIKEFGDPNYNYEVILEFHDDPRIVGRIKAIEKSSFSRFKNTFGESFVEHKPIY